MTSADLEKIKQLHPCQEGLAWVSQHSNIQEAWQKCVKGDWMLWYLVHMNLLTQKIAVEIACGLATDILDQFKNDMPSWQMYQHAKGWLTGLKLGPDVMNAPMIDVRLGASPATMLGKLGLCIIRVDDPVRQAGMIMSGPKFFDLAHHHKQYMGMATVPKMQNQETQRTASIIIRNIVPLV